jgi:hypothetical protein
VGLSGRSCMVPPLPRTVTGVALQASIWSTSSPTSSWTRRPSMKSSARTGRSRPRDDAGDTPSSARNNRRTSAIESTAGSRGGLRRNCMPSVGSLGHTPCEVAYLASEPSPPRTWLHVAVAGVAPFDRGAIRKRATSRRSGAERAPPSKKGSRDLGVGRGGSRRARGTQVLAEPAEKGLVHTGKGLDRHGTKRSPTAEVSEFSGQLRQGRPRRLGRASHSPMEECHAVLFSAARADRIALNRCR